MLYYDYTFRHNEVVRCIHLHLSRKYNFTKIKRLRAYKVSGVIENEYAKIIVDTEIKTDINVQHNRPDIVVYDKKRNEMIFIEVGITNQDILQSVELEKYRKYDILAKEVGRINRCPVKVVPYVVSWDGIVTKLHKKYRREQGIDRNIHAYIQSLSQN